MVLHIICDCDVVLLDHCDSTLASELLAHSLPVVLLSLNDMTTEHLRIFDLDLRIVENIIIVVDVLYYFNWLISLFFLRF